MPKPALEFFPVESVAWEEVSPGVRERMLARDPDGAGLTRLLRWDPGFDSSPQGPAVHAYVEEVYILAARCTTSRSSARCAPASTPAGRRDGPWPVDLLDSLRDARGAVAARAQLPAAWRSRHRR